MPRRTLLGLLATIAVIAAPTAAAAGGPPYQHTPQPVAQGTGGSAATADSVATTAATDALRAGGNAVDAAVAAAAVLGVTEPFSSGIGGGGFMIIRTPDGKVTTIDSREKSPAAMQPDSFFVDGVPPDPSDPAQFAFARYSGLSAGVPGTVAGWDHALREYGTWSLDRALQRGIDVARKGFVIDKTFYEQAQDNADYFDDIRSSEKLYLDSDGTARDIGTVQRNPGLARAYKRIARLGVKGFYSGAIARALTRAVQEPPLTRDANHIWRPGLMTLGDLCDYTAPEREPTHVDYRGLDVYGMGPPSSGGSTVGEALNILEEARPPWETLTKTQKYHWFLEASRFAFADRGAFLGDPAFSDIPLEGLLSQDYAKERAALIDPAKAQPGAVPPGDPEGDALRSTTHLTVADAEGTIVSYTFTIESTGGNGIVVPRWGFLLNNELTDFDINKLDHPNSPDGGKRPRSSIAPTIVLRDDVPVLATGTPGGSTIITTVLQILLERFDLGKTLPQAIAAPRAAQRNGATTQAEPAFIASPEGQQLASAFGHNFVTPSLSPPTNGEIGAATGIEFLDGGDMLAAAEPVRRGGGSAQVVSP
jgi:gamma-glutamyltranspeptidase / glutathione hydrolase